MNNYKNLKVCLEAMDLCAEVYKIVQSFPKEEVCSLTSQIKRSSISIPSNIAEGAGRNSKKEFINFLSMTNGSCCEVETQLILAHKLAYIDENILNNILDKTDHIQKMNFKLQKTLE